MAITNNQGVLFEIYRGDDKNFTVNVTDTNDVVVDITGWVIKSTLKLQTTDTDDEAAIKIDLPAMSGADATNGTFTLAFPNADTANLEPALYYFDIQAEANGLISTVIAGKVRVHADVTQRV